MASVGRESTPADAPADDRVVIVDEVVFVSDDGEFSYRSGRYSVRLVSKIDGSVSEQGPQAVTMQAAIDWGRRRASVLIGEGDRRVPVVQGQRDGVVAGGEH